MKVVLSFDTLARPRPGFFNEFVKETKRIARETNRAVKVLGYAIHAGEGTCNWLHYMIVDGPLEYVSDFAEIHAMAYNCAPKVVCRDSDCEHVKEGKFTDYKG